MIVHNETQIAFANRMKRMKASEIREILKITEQPQVISFAGGLPEPDLFPVKELQEVCNELLEQEAGALLQYSTTEGYRPLREWIVERMNGSLQASASRRPSVQASQVLITSGSQQGLDFAGKIMLNPGDVVLCESPTYLGAINALNAYEPAFVEVPTDDKGMDTEALKHILQTTERVKMIYVNPDFQNPTGRSWSQERREQFMSVVKQFPVIVIEDNPYGELRFEGKKLPTLYSLDHAGQVVYLGTFSKIFCPGLRIGWIAAPPFIMEKLVFVKQAADLHTSSKSQREIHRYLEKYDIDRNIDNIIEVYRSRRNAMLNALREEMPGEVRFTEPQGGLFVWVELPKAMDTRELLVECLRQQVAFVPGGSFFPNGGHENTMRLNYSNMKEERIVEGIRKLAKVVKAELSKIRIALPQSDKKKK